jgi:glycerol-3-phosphate acyltransferase PlsY
VTAARRRERSFTPPAVVVLGAAWVAGSVPFSQIAARRTRGVDLRQVGTGTVSGTGLYRVAGFGPLAVAGVAEVAKGALGVLLAGPERPGLAALAGGMAVAGHNWSPFLRGAGGRGLSPSLGALLPRHWPGTVTLLAGMAGGRLARASAVGVLVADMALVPVLARTRGRPGAWAGAAVLAPMLAKRLTGNHRPADARAGIYLQRLVFDRDTWAPPA